MPFPSKRLKGLSNPHCGVTSYQENLIADEVKVNHLGPRHGVVEMAKHRVSHHGLQVVPVFALRMDAISKRTCRVTPIYFVFR